MRRHARQAHGQCLLIQLLPLFTTKVRHLVPDRGAILASNAGHFKFMRPGPGMRVPQRPAPDRVESSVLHGGFLSAGRPSLLAACNLASDRLRAHLGGEKMLCPECEQGEVTEVQVRATQEILHLCQECELLWLSAEVIGTEPFNSFTSYMEELGLAPLWSSLYVLEPEKITSPQARKYLRSVGSI
ncbi:hypothetical protein VP719_13795 [Pseudomonas protegens]|uniref:hypothetical protein n=1 Tax=Pseudomonas protegens TaxID=380021 RepID=UPI002DBD5B0C|nr:hypothetical protein [Pseudomonas protegens]WRV94064.1 hypothetical protein VP719_13795 [Pseudomonas protegens]